VTPAELEKPGLRGLLKAGPWLLLLTLGCLSSLAAPPVDSSRNLDVWPVEDWPHNTATSIAQTADGYLWFGTYHGLIRYDGARFAIFDGSNTPGLRNGIITSLYLDSGGDLWIGHETGETTRMRSGQFTSTTPPRPWPGGPVEGFAQDEDQQLWLWNDRGQLFRFGDGKLLAMGIGSPVRKAGVSRAADGSLWVGLGQRVSRLNDGELVDPDPSLIAPGLSLEAIRGARDGGFWLLTREWIRKIRNGRVVAEFPPASAVENSITTTLELRNGNLLVATSREGLMLLEPGHSAQRFTRANGLLHDWVRALFEDHEGNVWVGTASGLNGLRHRRVHMIAPPDDWQGCALLSFSLRKDGSLWIGTEGAGLYRLTGNQWSRFAMEEGLPNNYVWSVLETRQGELLVGTWGAGVVVATNETFAPAGELGNLASPTPSLYEGRGGEIWVGTTTGLLRYESGCIVQTIGKDQLDFPDVRAITETQDGTLWFGMSGGGLGALSSGKVRQYRKGNAGLASDFVLSLSPDSDGTLWIGTGDAGLFRLRDGRFSSIGRAQGLLDSVIGHIVDDGNGYLWLGSRQGILRVSKSELHQAADGSLRSIHCLSYGKAEGLEAPAISGGFQPGACKTDDGRLWFPTTKGLAVLDGQDIRGNSHPPPVVIEEMLVDGQPVPLPVHSAKEQQAVRVSPGRQRFELRYTGLSFAAPDKVRFRYRLGGLESDWIEAGTRRVAPYSYLRPGIYHFRVIACNNDNVWNEAGADLRFNVLPFFWQTWWFRTLAIATAALSLGGAVFWISRRRIRRKLELLERQRALERERARIARDIHDDLGASLTRITMLSQGVRSDVQALPNTLCDVDQIYQTARELTRALDEIVWAVNPRHDTLDSLVTYLGRFAQSFLSTAGIRCRLDVPVQLPAWSLTSEIRHNLFLALKESLNNVAKHARATEVRISLELQTRGFVIHVVDNGCGFQQMPGEAVISANGGGNGLANMRKRVEELGGKCEWTTAPGEGTRICFTIELPNTPGSRAN
jgi:signal transduction histidine kinase/ligand-binding sensor domain-containing protein